MPYTTISGDLSEHTEWVAGTYYLTADCNLGNYNLTLNCSAGNIVIKTSGNKQIKLNGTGVIATSNSSTTKKVIFTSKNDDLHGDVIDGSSASPAIGDQSKGFLSVTANNVSVNFLHTEWWYCEVIDDGILDFGNTSIGQSVGISLSLTNITFKYCGLKNGSDTDSTFIGQWRRTGFLSLTIDGLYVDSTNRILESGAMKGTVVSFGNCVTVSITNINIELTCNNVGYGLIKIRASTIAIIVTLGSYYIKGNTETAALLFLASGVAASLTLTMQDGLIDMKDNAIARAAVSLAQASNAVFNFTMRRTTICNCNVGVSESGIITGYDEDYNNFYNNGTNATSALGAHTGQSNPIAAQPLLIGQNALQNK